MESPTFKNCIFDFDGTLVDSNRAIWQCTLYVLQNYQPETLEVNKDILGFEDFLKIHKQSKDLFDLFGLVYGLSRDDLKLKTPVKMHQQNSHKFFTADILYDGILDFLLELKQQKKQLFVATNNIKSNVESVFESYQEGLFNKLFTDIVDYYSVDEGRQKPDPQMVQILINKHNLEPQTTVLIGDDEKDFKVANAIDGLSGIGVSWGKYDLEKLKMIQPQPDYLVTDISNLKKIIN